MRIFLNDDVHEVEPGSLARTLEALGLRVVEEVTEWAARPLAMQASVDSQTQLKLLLYAACAPLRAAG